MIAAAKRLTWVEDIKPLRNVGKDIADWIHEVMSNGDGSATIGLWGASRMKGEHYKAMVEGLRGVARLEEIDGPLNALRAKKSSREIHLISRAADAVGVAFEAFSTARKAGAGARTAAIAAERAGFAFGAQQFGILASAKPGGPPLPLDGIEDRKVDPMLVYIAVRYAGYWSDGLVTVSDKPTGASSPTNAAIDAIALMGRTNGRFRQRPPESG